MGEKIRAHVLVSGRVQGVFFRDGMKRKAEKLEVRGWVKNLKDGRLEAVFEGEKENVRKMVEWVKGGPLLADVKKLEVGFEKYEGGFDSFEIEYEI
ncbi:MAG: acylphosphatase [Patescibacteria group bacterium]